MYHRKPYDWFAHTEQKQNKNHNAAALSNKAESVSCTNSHSPHGHSSGTHIWGRDLDFLREFLYKHSHSACCRNGCHSCSGSSSAI